MRKYKPLNRHLLVQEEDLDKDSSSQPRVLLPNDYKLARNFGTYRVLEIADDCKNTFEKGELIMVEENMVRHIDVDKSNTLFTVAENYVVVRCLDVEEG